MTEAEVRAVLNGQRAEVLLSVLDRAWVQYLADGRKRHYRARANVVWDNATLPGVDRRGSDDMPVYVFDDVLAVHPEEALARPPHVWGSHGAPSRARRYRHARRNA